MGRKTQNFHLDDTIYNCPKLVFSGLSDSKTRGKTGFLRNFWLTGVKYLFKSQFLKAPHGLKCERGKKILKRWGFLGVRMEKSGHFAMFDLTHINSFGHCTDGRNLLHNRGAEHESHG